MNKEELQRRMDEARESTTRVGSGGRLNHDQAPTEQDMTKEELQRRMDEARESITRVVSEIKESVVSRHEELRLLPDYIRESVSRFRTEYPDPSKVAFIMMKFGSTAAHEGIVAGVKEALEPLGITAMRADEKQYHDDLFYNIMTYMHGCGFGVAVFERIETDEFNPNVALEIGYMLALRKPVCFLKDRTLRNLHSDLFGRLYRVFDPLNPAGTIPTELLRWLKDKRLGLA